MLKKIIITGGLGYLGTELCRLYSGVSWKKKVIVLDQRFLSQRVNELKKWNIEFVQGAILDKNLVKDLLKDADVVHHLAGITDVAYLHNDVNLERDKLIQRVAIEGTDNIINSIPENCKLIFPSTHVVFEGLKNVKKDLTEEDVPCPILAYSRSKLENEKQIQKRVKNFIILRLASVYGYSEDSMRMSIMPNLFAKITSQNGTISLFSSGKQLKSLVPLIDVARCHKFMDENNIKNQIFHLSKDSLTVKDIALLCKKINPKVNLVETKNEIPNPGYSLSNKKLLDTGFKFLYGLEESLKEMIEKWSQSNKVQSIELESVKKGEKEFIDERGKISNYELSEPVNLIGYIESKKGTIRANHFHPIQEQKCLLIKGQYISVYKDLLESNSFKITHLINPGDSVVTKPNVAHTMVFTEDSIFLNLVRGEREHANYGITHTIPHIMVDSKERDFLIKNYKLNCRCCDGKNLKRIISLGYQPLANNLLNNINEIEEVYPLEVNWCSDCFNCQLSYTVEAEKLFKHYLYLSSTGSSFVNHFRDAAKSYIKQLNLNKSSQIIDIGSNDGIALKPFKDYGFLNILGIEPAKNLAEMANKSGIKTINGFLNKNLIKKIKKKADLLLASNVFAHVDDIKSMAECFFRLLKKDGVIIIEVQYLLNTLLDSTFDNIYHEHVNYWSVMSINSFFKKLNATVYKVEKINTHGGSIRVYVTKDNNIKIDKSVNIFINEEKKLGLNNFKIYKNFSQKVNKIKENVRKKIKLIKNNNKTIVAYGSPAKATTALNFYNISKEIDFIIEDNPLKQGKFLPGVKIPIHDKSYVKKQPDYLLVLAWNFFEDIKKNNKNLCKNIISIKDLE
jgi:nucleoside-diphosphate-sugar epimerase/2-polyprenyl-3-methyl-5-hydroxy-6-metoxy-1,4-benzoquinol methylase/dTDP-4-dehydrorhamnose 3,5-epimerase-like enzyme